MFKYSFRFAAVHCMLSCHIERDSFLNRKPVSFRSEGVCLLHFEIKSCDGVCSFSNHFFLHKNKPIKLNTTFCCNYYFLIRIFLNFGQSYIFYYLLSKHTFFPRGIL